MVIIYVIVVIVLFVTMLFKKIIFNGFIYLFQYLFNRFRKQNVKKILESSQLQTSVSTSSNKTRENSKEEIMVTSTEPASENLDNASTRVLTLKHGHHEDTTIYRLEKGWYLEFHLGPSLFGRKITIYTNKPQKGNQFSRSRYHSVPWSNPTATDDSLTARIQMHLAGSFHYYFLCDKSSQRLGSGYFIVDPVLNCSGETLPLNCIQSVTYLSKNLGPFSDWEKKLRVAKETGYNTIHFTPIQELGESQSAYSLVDQLKVNPNFSDEKKTNVTMEDIILFTDKLKKEWKMISICDIVLNHTANESPWLLQHPECTYNLVNCPYLKPAYLLDITLHNFSIEISKGIWELQGIPIIINTEEHLGALRYALLEKVLPKVKFEELFTVPVDKYVEEFLIKCRTLPPPLSQGRDPSMLPDIQIRQDPQFRRLKSTVDMELALRRYNVFRKDSFDEETRIHRCGAEFKTRLETLNQEVKNSTWNHLTAAVDNCIGGVRYFRVQFDGPRMTEISSRSPLFTRYFTDYKNEASEDQMYSENACYIMAHNGWTMNSDPLKNFAESGSQVYFRRELVAWGDSVKLRYGDSPKDCPYLWDRMRRYVELTVRAFDGVRLDNCHSTPIHVAEHLLDAGRLIRPNLYVVAELFTNSDLTDNLFVNRLGITSLIRESMSAWDSHELGRLVYRYGGDPVGAFIKPYFRPLTPSVAHALFLDLTHDNPSPVEKRSVFDLLPSSALVAMACCASGSNMGYDQLVPHHIHVVEEKRKYMEWGTQVNENYGISAGKKALNELHYYLGKNGFHQVFVDQVDADIVCVTRHNDVTHESVVLVSYTAFHHPNPFSSGEGKGVTVTGLVQKVLIEAYLHHRSEDRYSKDGKFTKDNQFINGLTAYELNIKTNFDPKNVSMVDLTKVNDNSTRVNFTAQFKPGCIIALKFSQNEKVQTALKNLAIMPNLNDVKKNLTLADLNKVLYCCDLEDDGVYNVPNFSPFVYCGLQGVLSFMDTVAFNNDLGHPICHNLREGNWMLDYTTNRLKKKAGTKQLAEKLDETFKNLKEIPRYLIPCYFYNVINFVYREMVELAWSHMSSSVKNGSQFTKSLALGSVQFGGIVDSSPLPPLSSNIDPPVPAVAEDSKSPLCVSLSAGLPHFAVGYMRNWGRDTFIALRGLFLLTGRFDEARYIILAYGGCLRHGLIPNLLDGGKNPRYNCRDAVWWWLYTIKNYVSIAPNGEAILNDKVNRLFPTDDSPISPTDQPLHAVMQEALNTHFQGLCFRERNAGLAIDAHMKSAGFNNQIGVHPATGFVFGGNEWNCGTWMDKMGSSDKAGNRGKPATPRDGSAVEIVALCSSVVSWLADVNKKKLYPYDGVSRKTKEGNSRKITYSMFFNGEKPTAKWRQLSTGHQEIRKRKDRIFYSRNFSGTLNIWKTAVKGAEINWTYSEWSEKIKLNFEREFWIPTVPSSHESRPDLVHRRGIYKDCLGAAQPWTDYQLRCNYCVAMVVAPELFSNENAWTALEQTKLLLLGPLGIKTLDPADWSYNGLYDNSDDSSNPNTAHGFNYHQGPEWLWPVGYYLRARIYYASKQKKDNFLNEVLSECKSYLANHYTHLKDSDWKGLPELTNRDGAYCPFSCSTQAWSMASILEAVDDIMKAETAI